MTSSIASHQYWWWTNCNEIDSEICGQLSARNANKNDETNHFCTYCYWSLTLKVLFLLVTLFEWDPMFYIRQINLINAFHSNCIIQNNEKIIPKNDLKIIARGLINIWAIFAGNNFIGGFFSSFSNLLIWWSFIPDVNDYWIVCHSQRFLCGIWIEEHLPRFRANRVECILRKYLETPALGRCHIERVLHLTNSLQNSRQHTRPIVSPIWTDEIFRKLPGKK